MLKIEGPVDSIVEVLFLSAVLIALVAMVVWLTWDHRRGT